MAACIDTSRTETSQSNQLSRDPNRHQTNDQAYKYTKFCRPVIQNLAKATHKRTIVDVDEDIDQEDDHYDDLWLKVRGEAQSDVDHEPILSSYYHSSILPHNSLERALANHLSLKLSHSSLPSSTPFDLFRGGARVSLPYMDMHESAPWCEMEEETSITKSSMAAHSPSPLMEAQGYFQVLMELK